MKINFYKWLAASILITLVSWLALNAMSYRPAAFDGGAYVAYTESLINDGDFNIINNIKPEMGWMISGTQNYPDMHDQGVSLLWVPFAIFAKIPEKMGFTQMQTSRGNEPWILACILIASIFLFLYGQKILIQTIRPGTLGEKFIFYSFVVATPLLFYVFLDFTSADIAAFFISCICLFLGFNFKLEKKSHFATWGALFSLARIIKISFVFWLPFFLVVLILNAKNLTRKRALSGILFFIIGIAFVLLLKSANDYLQFGYLTLANGYDYDYLFSHSDYLHNLYKNIFGVFGVFHSAQWLILSFACWCWLLWINKKNSRFFVIVLSLGLGTLAKFLYESTGLSDGEAQYGYRRYINDIPFCLFFIITTLQSLRARINMSRLVVTAYALILVYALVYFFWHRLIDQYHYSAFGAYSIWELNGIFKTFLKFLFEIKTWILQPRLYSTLPLLFVLSLIFSSLLFIKENFVNMTVNFIKMLVIFYFLATALNVTLNKKNSEEMRKFGFLENKVVSHSELVFLYDEILSDLGRTILIAKYNRDEISFKTSSERLISYLNYLPDLVVKDPLNFSVNLRNGILRKTYQDPNMEVTNLLDYNAQSYFNRTYQETN